MNKAQQNHKNHSFPLFWKYFIMMLCLVAVACIAMFISNSIHMKNLRSGYLAQAQSNLEHNAEKFETSLYATSTIPKIVEETDSYKFIRSEISGTLPMRYYSVLPGIGKALRSQLYLYQDMDECFLYLAGVNSICSKYNVFPVAEDCFTSYLHLSDSTTQEIIDLLSKKNSICFLPMQDIRIGGDEAVPRMALIIRPVKSSISVMSLFSGDTIKKSLGLESLPKEVRYQILSSDGTKMTPSPFSKESPVTDKWHELTASMPTLHLSVHVWIPDSYFAQQIQDVVRTSWISVVLMVLVGFLLCLLFSRAATEPIRKLYLAHASEGETEHGSEIDGIADVLDRSKHQIEKMQKTLTKNRLAQALSGKVLSKSEEELLIRDISMINPPYRVVLFHIKGQPNLSVLTELTQIHLSQDSFSIAVNEREVGILLSADLTLLDEVRVYLNNFRKCSVFCGASGPFSILQDIQKAVWQARIAIPKEQGLGVFSMAVSDSPLSWLQHERLFQSILDDDEERSIILLQSISRDQKQDITALEAFYSIRFVLRNAATEIDLPFDEINQVQYDHSLLPTENIERMIVYARLLFERNRERRLTSQASREGQILARINTSYSDFNLNAQMVAEEFGLCTKSIYAIIRKVTGQSFNEYLTAVRMKQAARELCSTNYSVDEIILRCGYPSKSTFYRVFKNYYGISPNLYRQNQGEEPENMPDH